jgi:ATP-dependent RNA helicase DDX19/DBP5
VQEALLSLFASDPLHNVIMEYPPGTGRTTALVIALLSRIDYSSTTQPQVLVIVPDRLLVHQMGNHIKEIGSFCDGLVVQTVHILVEKTAMFEANVIVATPGILLDKIQRRLIKTSEVRLLVVDDVDYVEDSQGLSDQCIRVSRMLPKSFQFLLSSDLLRRASAFARSLTLSKAWEKLELKEAELNVNKVVHLFFRCKHEQEKLDIICKLPGLVQISMLIIFVGVSSQLCLS